MTYHSISHIVGDKRHSLASLLCVFKLIKSLQNCEGVLYLMQKEAEESKGSQSLLLYS